MNLTEVLYSEAVPIESYGPGFFRVGGEVVQGGLLLLPDRAPASWGGFDDLEAILAAVADIDVLFVGTGGETAHVPTDFRATVENAGAGVEQMASAAACRTFNVLLSEGRRIGLAALPV